MKEVPHLPYNELPALSDEERIAAARAFREEIAQRRTCRMFAPDAVPREVIEEAILAAGSAPSGANHQPWHFAVVTSLDLKSRIRAEAEQEEAAFYAGKAGQEWLAALAPLGADADREEAATSALPAHDPPEILEADLSSLLLTCLLWGEADPTRLPFLDPPPAAALAEARVRLTRLEAVRADGQLTPHGRAIARLPLEPRLAHMLIEAGARGFGQAATAVAVLITERGLGGNDTDLEVRHRRWRDDRGPRAEGARRMAKNWARASAPPARAEGVDSPKGERGRTCRPQ